MVPVGYGAAGYWKRLTKSAGRLFTDAGNLFGPEPSSCVGEVEYSPFLA